MPSIEELRNAARENARQRLQADRAKEAVGSRALEQRELSKPKEEAAPTGVLKESTEADDRTRALSEAVGGRDTRPADLQTDLVRSARAADDLARVLAGPLGNIAAGTFGESTIPEEARRTAAAAERLGAGPNGAALPVAQVGGQLAQALAIPGSAFTTPGRATLSGGGLGIVDTIFGRMEEGKPLASQEGIEDVVAGAGQGAAGGFVGAHLGRMFGNLVSKLSGTSPRLAAEADRIVKSKMEVADRAGKEMDDSKVFVSSGALNHFVNTMRKQFDSKEFSPAMAPNGWRAMRVLQQRAARNEDIPLRNFNEIRKVVRDSVRVPSTGQIKESVNGNDMTIIQDLTKGMHKLINTLPQRTSTTGDVKKGVAAWNRMNKNFMEGAKADTLADLIASAERQARGGEKAIDVALRDEFKAFTNSKVGKKILESEYTTGQRQLIEKLAIGDFSQQVMNRLDRYFGGGKITSTVFEAVRSGHALALEAEASRHLARKAVNSAAGIPVSLMERLNAGTKGIPGMRVPPGPALGGAVGAAGVGQIPAGQGQPQRAMQAPPTGAPSGVPRNLAKPLPAQSQSATPQFPQVPGVTRMPSQNR